MPDRESLEGRVALVTGASSGIGAAVALAIGEAGGSVVLTARREDRLEDLAGRIGAAGGRALVRPADVTVRAEVEAVGRAAREAWGRIDILVNNAGLMPLAPLAEVRVEEWDRMIDVNLKGVLHGLGAVLPDMIERRSGHIVNIGSLAGRRPFPGGAVYSATKFAVRSLTWGMHLELGAAYGIRVTDVQPGFVSTELLEGTNDEEVRAAWSEAWASRRALRPEDVAHAVLFALTAPAHVAVNEVLVRPVDQPT